MINPGMLKLELFCSGMKVDASCDIAHDARSILRTRGGLGSGLEIILPKKVYVNVPIEEEFVKNSPFTLFKDRGQYYLKRDNQTVCAVVLPPKPDFYEKMTSSGKKMSRIGVLQGTYLGIYSSAVCEFWTMKPAVNCKFCSVGLNLGTTEETEKTVEDVIETVLCAQKEERITFVHFNTGFLSGKELDMLLPFISRVKKETGLLVGVQCPPAPDFSVYDTLKRMGVDHVSFCIELFDAERFKEVCPGKCMYLGQKKYLDTMEYCVRLFGKGKVAGEIIAGLEDVGSTIQAIEYFAKRGIVSTVCVFRPCRDTALAACPPPNVQTLIPVFRRMYEVCIEHDIPVGIAPNINVSIVIMPVEGRFFINDKSFLFRMKELKMGILKMMFRIYFTIKLTLKRL